MSIKDRVCQHLKSLNYPAKESARYASLIQKWVAKSGPEWTVERLKSLKQAHQEKLQAIDGSYTPPIGWATRVNSHGKKILKDGLLHRALTHTRLTLRQVEGLLRIYQVITLDQTSKRQLAKMQKAIEAPALYEPGYPAKLGKSASIRNPGRALSYIVRTGDEVQKLPDLLGSSKKRSPTFDYSTEFITYSKSVQRSKAESADWAMYFGINPTWNSFWNKYPDVVAKAFGTSNIVVDDLFDIEDETPRGGCLLGSVVVLQSPGAKARWIANPLLAIQAIGEPLKAKLLAYSKSVYPEIKTQDQDAGHQVVVDWLRSGRKVFSFDATAFTDRFPVEFQLEIARKLLQENIITPSDFDALEKVVSGVWWSVDLKRCMKWEVGQPLGYGPSFHLATLAHAVMLDNIDIVANGRATSCWQVVGDDVVISDPNVARVYKKKMTEFGVEINLSKSLISPEYAEFLGKLITKEGVNPSIKVKILSGHSQIIDALAFYGVNGWKHLSHRERLLAMDAFMPSHLGGLGWRIPGQSYKRFLELVNQSKIRDKTVRKEVVEFFGRTDGPASSSFLLELRSEYYSRNSLMLSQSEWELFAEDGITINESTDIPIRESEPNVEDGGNGVLSTNRFTELVDTIVRLEGLTNQKAFDEQGRVNRSNAATSVLTDQGYISNSEKEPRSQSDHIEDLAYDESNTKPSRGIFSKEFIGEAKSFPEESERILADHRRNVKRFAELYGVEESELYEKEEDQEGQPEGPSIGSL